MFNCRSVYGVPRPILWVQFLERHISDTLEIEKMGQRLYQLVENHSPQFVLDFAEVEYVSSAALGKLISLNAKVKARSGRMVFCNIRPELWRIFEICHLDRIFEIRQDDADALACFSL